MAVALAVRLAILQCMSRLRMIILDEPTAYLDPKRKAGLVESISAFSQMSAIEQLFVITHDNAFANQGAHFIQVEKKDGISMVKAD